jgi:hypothetical protein
VVRAYSSDDPAPAEPGPQAVSILWRQMPARLSTAAGHHRWVWDLRPTPTGGGRGGGGGFRGGAPMLTGNFTVRLTAGGQTFTQPLVVKPDPRTP